MDDLLADFVAETEDGLDLIEAELLRFETHPGESALLGSLFRRVHTIKGACGFLALPRLAALADAAETLIARARADGAPFAVEPVLRTVDRMRGLLAGLRLGAGEPAGDDSALLQELQRAARGKDALAPAATSLVAAPRSVRVEAAALDALAEAANGVLCTHFTALRDLPAGEALAADLAALVAQIEALRRWPISEAWRALPRLARETAAGLGKRVALTFEGEHVRVEAATVEALRAPLIHLTRNAIAHGVESPTERAALGKPEAGHVRIAAREEANAFILEITDDGRGLDAAYLRRRGIERGLLSAADAARLSDDEAIALVFAPGFSTATTVTAVSGRGVGLDAVKTTVASLGGTIETETAPGVRTTFRIRAPHRVEAAARAPLLLIDPDEPFHDRLRPLLSAAGYDVQAAPPGQAPAPFPKPVRKERRG
jgi:two-component system chemotaxis sensor kinase CheA